MRKIKTDEQFFQPIVDLLQAQCAKYAPATTVELAQISVDGAPLQTAIVARGLFEYSRGASAYYRNSKGKVHLARAADETGQASTEEFVRTGSMSSPGFADSSKEDTRRVIQSILTLGIERNIRQRFAFLDNQPEKDPPQVLAMAAYLLANDYPSIEFSIRSGDPLDQQGKLAGPQVPRPPQSIVRPDGAPRDAALMLIRGWNETAFVQYTGRVWRSGRGEVGQTNATPVEAISRSIANSIVSQVELDCESSTATKASALAMPTGLGEQGVDHRPSRASGRLAWD